MYEDVLTNVTQVVALIAGTATAIAIPAPGATQRIRIVGVHLGINRQAGAAIVDVLITDGAGGNTVANARGLSLTGNSWIDITIPGPGIVLTLATACILSATSTAATGSAFCTVYYFIDDRT
jgi:hypothetical protein